MTRALVFCGAFNPPTLAHIGAAHASLLSSGLEQVVFVPSRAEYIRKSQHKDFAFGDAQRLWLLQEIAAVHPWMRVSSIELDMDHQPRTYETLCRLRDRDGLHGMLLLGSDKLPELDHLWRYVPEMAREFGIACMPRQGEDCQAVIKASPFLTALGDGLRVLDVDTSAYNGISSTRVRALLGQMQELAESCAALLPEGAGDPFTLLRLAQSSACDG